MKRIIIILIPFLIVSFTSLAKFKLKTWEKTKSKIEIYYHNGDYKEAKKLCDKLYKQADEGKIGNNQISQFLKLEQSSIVLTRLLIEIELGITEDQVTNQANKELSNILSTKGKESYEYLEALNKVANIFIHIGNFREANDYLKMGSEIAAKGNRFPEWEKEFQLTRVKVLSECGFFNESIKLAKELPTYLKEGFGKNVRSIDPKTLTYTTRKPTKVEINAQKRRYAQLHNLMSDILLRKGDVRQADSLVKLTRNWISKEIGKSDISYADNLLLKAKIYIAVENKDQAVKEGDKAIKSAAKGKDGLKYKFTSRQYADFVEFQIFTFWENNQERDASTLKKKYTPIIRRYFNNKNYHEGRLMLMDITHDITREKYERAEEDLREILSNEEYLPKYHPLRHRALLMALNVYSHFDYVKDAITMVDQLIQLDKHNYIENSPYIHTDLTHKAIFLADYTNEIKEAETLFEQSFLGVVRKELHPMHPEYLYFSNKLSEFYMNTDQYDKSYKTIIEGLAVSRKEYADKNHRVGSQYVRLAELNLVRGKFKDAHENLLQAGEIFNILENRGRPEIGDLNRALVKLLILTGQYNDAEDALNKATRTERHANEKAADIADYAALYIKKGDYSDVEEAVSNALSRKSKLFGEGSIRITPELNQLAELYNITGDFSNADKLINQSLQIIEKIYGEQSVKYTDAAFIKSKIYFSVGDYENAESLLNKVLIFREKTFGKKHLSVANTLNELALTKYQLKRPSEQIKNHLLESAKIIEENLGKNTPSYAEALKNVAFFYIETNKLDDADQLLETANEIWVKKSKLGRLNVNTAEVLMLRGEIQKRKGNFTKSIGYYDQAADSYKAIFNDKHPKYVNALSKLGVVYYITGDNKKAIRTLNQTTEKYLSFIRQYFPTMSESEKTKFWSLIKNDFEFYNTLAVNSNDEDLIANMYNFTLSTKALLLNSSVKIRQSIMSSGNQTLINKFNQWQEKRDLLALSLAMDNEQLKEKNINRDQLEKEANDIEKELSELSEIFGSDNKNKSIAWQDIQKSLKPNEYALEIIRYRYYKQNFTDSVVYAALVLSNETKKAPQLIVLEGGNKLEKDAIKYYRNTIKFKLKDDKTYNAFWKPLQNTIKDNSTVYLSPEGVYNQINLESVLVSGNQYLIDKVNIITVTNTKEILNRNKNTIAQSYNATLIGNPTYYNSAEAEANGTIDPLPGSEREVNSIETLLKKGNWKPTKIIGKEATEEAVRKVVNPRVLHIATHGFFIHDDESNNEFSTEYSQSNSTNNPLLQSGLIFQHGGDIIDRNNTRAFNLEGGILTAFEAMNLNLDNTELVVLSACETGLGDVRVGEGVYGLQRSFIVAGAESLIMSLFKVNDEVTNKLMTLFYAKWTQSNDKRKAFIEAKKEIRKEYPDPIFWGSFVMVGMSN